MRPGRWLLCLTLLGGCANKPSAEDNADSSAPAPIPQPITPKRPEPQQSADAHRVVFADRTSQGYLLLVDEAHMRAFDRQSLQDLVRKKLSGSRNEPEVQLLLQLITTPPQAIDPKIAAASQPADGRPRETSDLLGLHIDSFARKTGDEAVVSEAQLLDPVLTRYLDPEERRSLARRSHIILLRADYRNRFNVRGLRLLQTLVQLVANERQALIHDPDTKETMGLAAFAERRLVSTLGNVADQVAVVPFPDPRHGTGFVRLATRGMRRFGSVDVELDGLPTDPQVLQSATHFMYGLAYKLVRLGEFDPSGYAVELDDVVSVDFADVQQAYSKRPATVTPCEDCPQTVFVHLVERPAQSHDPQHHVVARVVAPRDRSDSPQYDQPAWAAETLNKLLGP